MKAKGFTCFYIGKAKDLNIHFEQEKDYPTLFETKGNPEQVFKQWFKLMGISPPKAKPAIGWTSWYHYYIKKDEQIIKANLNGFIKKEIPIGVFQIDDGWQHALRDWIGTNSKFPSSLKIIIEEAKKAGIKPGLWLAPFIAKKTLGDLMASAMEFLREVVGEKIILACGVPLASAFGNVDYCRTGADIHLSWDHTLLRFLRNRERVSTRLALQNRIGRNGLNGLGFIGDPDVFILRPTGENCALTDAEKYTILLINQLFGDLIFCSDVIEDYDKETKLLYRSIFPLVKRMI